MRNFQDGEKEKNVFRSKWIKDEELSSFRVRN